MAQAVHTCHHAHFIVIPHKNSLLIDAEVRCLTWSEAKLVFSTS